jgi:hypothetical protein
MTGHADDLEGMPFGGQAPTVEVVIYQHGSEIHRELCESIDAAEAVVEEWGELEGVECTVDELGARHAGEEIPDVEPPGTDIGSDYPHEI